MIATRSFVSAIIPDQSSTHADDAARGLETGSADYRIQPAARARAGAIHVTAEPCGDVDAGLHADRSTLSGEGRRRFAVLKES